MSFGFRIGAIFNSKLKKGLQGRKNSFSAVRSKISKNDQVIWMHAASLGEYEQGLPVLEKLKKIYPQYKILVSFFSPSGYEIAVKKNHIADVLCYLPFDKETEIRKFVSCFKTEIFFTVKYEYWYNLLKELHKNKVNVYVVAALFYEKQIFFKPYGKWFVRQLKENVTWFFHQNENSCYLAQKLEIQNASVSGDTRFDRVRQNKQRSADVDFIPEFKNEKKLIVFGSSWESEEKIAKIIHSQTSNVKIIIAPHDLKRVKFLTDIFPDAVLYSSLTANSTEDLLKAKILIIDNIGLLSKLYSYADLAVVGGGFHGAGLHNILEAATFGIPVFFGNKYAKNPEADELINRNGGKSFEDEETASRFLMKWLQDFEALKNMGRNAGEFIASQPHSTEIIIRKIISDYRENKSEEVIAN